MLLTVLALAGAAQLVSPEIECGALYRHRASWRLDSKLYDFDDIEPSVDAYVGRGKKIMVDAGLMKAEGFWPKEATDRADMLNEVVKQIGKPVQADVLSKIAECDKRFGFDPVTSVP